MKRIFLLVICVLLLSGCSAEQTMETLADDLPVSAAVDASKIFISVDGEDAAVFYDGNGGELYLCEGYTVAVQTLAGGDVARSVELLTGFSKENLTVMQTTRGGLAAYEYVWCAAGESEDQICRGMLIDDGTYHYAVTVMADYTLAGQLQDTWQMVFDSVTINTDSEH